MSRSCSGFSLSSRSYSGSGSGCCSGSRPQSRRCPSAFPAQWSRLTGRHCQSMPGPAAITVRAIAGQSGGPGTNHGKRATGRGSMRGVPKGAVLSCIGMIAQSWRSLKTNVSEERIGETYHERIRQTSCGSAQQVGFFPERVVAGNSLDYRMERRHRIDVRERFLEVGHTG